MAKKAEKPVHSAGSKDIETGKVCAALSYILIGIIWYFADENMKKNGFAKFHAKQGLVLLIAAIAYDIVLGIIVGALLFPLLFSGMGGWGLFSILRLLYYVPLIFIIIGIINALNGNEKELPIIGGFASKLNF
jgi:uncharacterized membrane protein